MDVLNQSKVYNTITHSQVYQLNFQPPIELLLRKMKIKSNMQEGKEAEYTLTDPLLVFDPQMERLRKANEKDGLFFFLTHRPSLQINKQNDMRSLLLSRNLGTGAMEGGPALQVDETKVRTLRMLICVAMSNETLEEFEITMNGIHENLGLFSGLGCCDEDIAVVVIIDGLDKMHDSMKEMFLKEDRNLKIPKEKRLSYRSEIFKTPEKYPQFSEYPRDSMYCYQLTLKPEGLNTVEVEDHYLNTFLCTKLQSSGRLASHLWFFRGFCEMFNPDYCVLMKAGVRPEGSSLFEIFRTFEGDDKLGGICGYTTLTPEPIFDKFGVREDQALFKNIDFLSKFMTLFFDIQNAQVFDAIFHHLIEKSFESFFGFLSYLEADLAGYRWDALRKRKGCNNIIDDVYLKTITDAEYVNSKKFSWSKATLYLAEDRMLALEIFSRKDYTLKYIPAVKSFVDPIKHLTSFLNERRKLINKSWFSMRYIMKICWGEVLVSNHNIVRILMFYLLMLFKGIEMLTMYFSTSVYVVVVYYVFDEFCGQYRINSEGSTGDVAGGILFFFISILAAILFYSLMYKVRERVDRFHLYSTILSLGFIMFLGFVVYLIIMTLFLKEKFLLNGFGVAYVDQLDSVPIMHKQVFAYFQPKYPDVRGNLTVEAVYKTVKVDQVLPIFYTDYIMYGVILNVGCYLLVLLMSFKRHLIYDVLASFKDYVYYWPVYKYVSIVYAFCNIDELTFDTFDGGIKIDQTQVEDKALQFKMNYVYKWLFLNMCVAYGLMILLRSYLFKKWFILGVVAYFSAGVLIKCGIAIIYQIKYNLFDRCSYYLRVNRKRVEYLVKTREIKQYMASKMKGNATITTSIVEAGSMRMSKMQGINLYTSIAVNNPPFRASIFANSQKLGSPLKKKNDNDARISDAFMEDKLKRKMFENAKNAESQVFGKKKNLDNFEERKDDSDSDLDN